MERPAPPAIRAGKETRFAACSLRPDARQVAGEGLQLA
jgi:hypothetical protein